MVRPVDVVLAVKELRYAKTRLAGASADVAAPGVGRERAHRDLALALAADTLDAVLASRVRAVVVVSSDPRARALARSRRGPDGRVEVVDDPGRGLDAAVRAGAAALRGRPGAPGAVAALQADLPALRAAELDAALGLAPDDAPDGAPDSARDPGGPLDGAGAAFVADHVGTGTTLLLTPAGRDPQPRFGPGSAAAHAAAGAVALLGAWPGLRLDVDTPEDLRRARELGVGPATAAWPAAADPAAPVNGERPAGVGSVPIPRHGCDV